MIAFRMNAQPARVTALVLATAATIFFLVAPVYASYDGGYRRLLEVAPRAVIVLLAPVPLTIVPLVVRPGRARRLATGITAVALFCAALLGMFIVGFFYMPSAVALLVAAVLPDRVAKAD